MSATTTVKASKSEANVGLKFPKKGKKSSKPTAPKPWEKAHMTVAEAKKAEVLTDAVVEVIEGAPAETVAAEMVAKEEVKYPIEHFTLPTAPKRYFQTVDYSERFNVDYPDLIAALNAGLIKGTKTGRTWTFDDESFHAWLSSYVRGAARAPRATSLDSLRAQLDKAVARVKELSAKVAAAEAAQQ